MKLGSLHSKTLATLILLLLVNAALSFDIALFFPGSTVYSGTSLQLRIQNGPSRVNVKFAVQNTDNTLTSIESSTVYNVAPDSMATVVRVSNDIKPGINYWVVAVDASNAESYATYGPFSIFQMLGGNPSASVTVGSGTSYATAGGSAATPSATGQTSSSKPTSTASSTTKGSATGTSESTPKSSPGEGDDPGSLIKLSLGTIVGIAVGGAVGGAILGLLAYVSYMRVPIPASTKYDCNIFFSIFCSRNVDNHNQYYQLRLNQRLHPNLKIILAITLR